MEDSTPQMLKTEVTFNKTAIAFLSNKSLTTAHGKSTSTITSIKVEAKVMIAVDISLHQSILWISIQTTPEVA